MRATRAGAIATGSLALLALVGCATGPTEEQTEASWSACVDAFNARPEVIEQAWTENYESVWKVGNLWWEFGAGDICDDLQDEADPVEWVDHVDDPDWFVAQYPA